MVAGIIIKMLRKHKFKFLIIILSAVVVANLLIYLLAPLASAEKKLADIRIAAMQPAQPISDKVTVVAIDEQTLASFPYRSPVNRHFLAELLENLDNRGALAIGVDVIFDQATEHEADESLKAALLAMKTPVGVSFTSSPAIVNEDQLAFLNDFVPDAMRMEANLLTDPYDGLVRRINPGGEIVDGQRKYTALKPPGFVAKMVNFLNVEAPKMPVEIAWRSQPDQENLPFPVLSASYAQFLPDELLSNRIVLVGAVLSITDRHATPLSIIDDGYLGRMPGVLVQANAIDQILEARRPPSYSVYLSIVLSLFAAIIAALISLSERPLAVKVGTAFLAITFYWIFAVVGFGYGIPLLPVLSPSLALAIGLWLLDTFIGAVERRQRKHIQGTFSRFVAPSVVEQLAQNPEAANVSGIRKETTFLFTDVAGFTTLSEQLEPESLSSLLNDYLDGACKIILSYQGTIDKFIGDAIMVIFNAPLDQADHSARAVRCALDLDAYAEGFRMRANVQGLPFGITRIGIHRGDAIIGNFGSEDRLDFTALGDTVNVAARTEGVNKYFGTRVCATQEVAVSVGIDKFQLIGDVILKGKVEATRLYTPIPDDADPDRIIAYKSAYKLLVEEDPSARLVFEKLRSVYEDDAVIKFHHRRLESGLCSSRIVMDEK